MGRLLALILGGLALALYVPPFFVDEPAPPPAAEAKHSSFDQVFIDTIGETWYRKTRAHGAGVFAGLALILFSVRGKD